MTKSESGLSVKGMEKNRVRAVRSPGFLTAVMLAFVFLVTFNCSTAFAMPPSGWYLLPHGWYHGEGWYSKAEFLPKDPNNLNTYVSSFRIGCIAEDTREWLDCRFNVSVAVDTRPFFGANGGHTHSRMVDTGIGTLSGIGAIQVSPYEVRGQTFQTNIVEYHLPEMAGFNIMKVVLRPPLGYMCMPNNSLAACTDIIQTAILQHWWLVPLPPSAAGEYELTGLGPPASKCAPANEHMDNHYGRPELVAAIQEVAKNFKKDSGGRVLGINDMSLPWGGLYDYCNTGTKPHTFHRNGKSVDIDSKAVRINQDMNQGIDPYFQDMLTDAFEKLGCDKVEEGPIYYECQ